MAIDISRETSGILLPTEISNQIWQGVQEKSAVMRLAQYMDIPGGGVEVEIISGDPQAEWVGETEERPVDTFAFDNKKIQGYAASVIVPFSNQ